MGATMAVPFITTKSTAFAASSRGYINAKSNAWGQNRAGDGDFFNCLDLAGSGFDEVRRVDPSAYPR